MMDIQAIKNMKYILDNSSYKIGVIEREAGVCLGYFSRKVQGIEKGRKEQVALGFLNTFAKHVGISMDTLVNVNLEEVIKPLMYEKLIKDILDKLNNIHIPTDMAACSTDIDCSLSSSNAHLVEALQLIQTSNSKCDTEIKCIFEKLSK